MMNFILLIIWGPKLPVLLLPASDPQPIRKVEHSYRKGALPGSFLDDLALLVIAERTMSNVSPYFRKDLGPLTTPYTPPDSCSTLFVYYIAAGVPLVGWGETCVKSRTANYLCNGPNTATIRNDDDVAMLFYSPALSCPHGQTGACTISRDAAETNFVRPGRGVWSQKVWSVLQNGETAVKCCPR